MQQTSKISTTFVKTVAIVYLYVFLEWVFFVTKNSYLDRFGFFEQVEIFLTSSLYFVVTASCAYAVFALIHAGLPAAWLKKLPVSPRVVVAAGFATVLTVLFVDNFTYTLFGIGIIRTHSYQVVIYALAVAGLFYWFLREFTLGDELVSSEWLKKGLRYGCAAIFLASLVLALWRLGSNEDVNGLVSGEPERNYPNILLFAADGIEADRLPLYGYHRDTAPNLARLSANALIAQAAIANAGRTTGSTTSMLTGKLPTTTKVLFPPHALSGKDSFEHLPGILRGLGYRTSQETVRYYGDSVDLNMRNSFQVANRRVVAQAHGKLTLLMLHTFANSMLLIERLQQRVEERFLHLAGIARMVAPLDTVTNQSIAKVYGFSDAERIERSIAFINESDAPFFSHVHLMDSHCCHYQPRERLFSSEHEALDEENRGDFLDDTIRDSDRLFGKLIDALEQGGKLDNTIIVYYSDHTEGWRTDRRLPLVFLFPGGRHAGRIEQTVQLLDVAPTLIDYLGPDSREWMEGESLLEHEKLDPMRPVYSVSGIKRVKFDASFDRLSQLVGEGPPYFGMKRMGLTICQRRYVLDVRTGYGEMSDLPMHPSPCDESRLPDLNTGLEMISKHLVERGFEPRKIKGSKP